MNKHEQFTSFLKHFGQKNAYETLGLDPKATAEQIAAAWDKLPEDKKTDAALQATIVLEDPTRKALYDEWRKAHESMQKVVGKAASAATEQIKRYSIKNPVVALGMTAVASTAAFLGVRSTLKIAEKKRNDEKPELGDRVTQVASLATLGTVVAAAIEMWKPGTLIRR